MSARLVILQAAGCFVAGPIDTGQQKESKVSPHGGGIEVHPLGDPPFPTQVGIFSGNFRDLRGEK